MNCAERLLEPMQISSILMHGFLSKCKSHFILPAGESKWRENNKNIELELSRNDVR